jgi:hypothetical protein
VPYEGECLLDTLRNPATVTGFDWQQWNALLYQGRQAGILAQLFHRLDGLTLLSRIPPKVVEILKSAALVADENKRSVIWELNRLERALRNIGVKVVLLKGAAYHMAELPLATGRLCGDVDILVAKSRLRDVEGTLLERGWEALEIDEYDQHYYRTWMHELPPMLHKDRNMVVDVHHALLPETSRLKTDVELLLESAVPLKASPFYYTLAPKDMVLHSATHLFQDGFQDSQPDMALRDLTDIDEMLKRFGEEAAFWDGLVLRGRQLGLQRPLFYALRYAERVFNTPLPSWVQAEASRDGPPRAIQTLMDAQIMRVFRRGHLARKSLRTGLARTFLYIRSHWLRMPPLLLAQHLIRKGSRRLVTRTSKEQEADL